MHLGERKGLARSKEKGAVANIDESMLERMWLCHPSSELLLSKRDSILNCKLVDSTRLAKIKEGPERRAANLASGGIEACIAK